MTAVLKSSAGMVPSWLCQLLCWMSGKEKQGACGEGVPTLRCTSGVPVAARKTLNALCTGYTFRGGFVPLAEEATGNAQRDLEAARAINSQRQEHGVQIIMNTGVNSKKTNSTPAKGRTLSQMLLCARCLPSMAEPGSLSAGTGKRVWTLGPLL